MNEFGHASGSIAGGHFDIWGAGPFVMVVNDRKHRFLDSDCFGPQRLRAIDLEPAKQWGMHNAFWSAHQRWVEQGRRTKDDGETCIVDLVEA